jgi:hypothetical protein
MWFHQGLLQINRMIYNPRFFFDKEIITFYYDIIISIIKFDSNQDSVFSLITKRVTKGHPVTYRLFYDTNIISFLFFKTGGIAFQRL